MKTTLRPMPDLELALLRRGVEDLAAETQRCARCHRHPLVGERVYGYASGRMLCELCREVESARPASSRLIHGPEFGHTMKIIDQRPPATPALRVRPDADRRAGSRLAAAAARSARSV